MCSIAGIFDPAAQRPIDRALLERMNEVQFHRGPDEGGIHLEPGVGLAHRRLSIIDLSSGQQPMYNADRSVVIVYNGEVYNFPELTRELQELGYQFRTHCDTEAILHAWEAWGEECVHRLRGMFAFAVWDRNRRCLFLARDRLGIKPLHWALLPDGRLIFGSELKALTCDPALSREIDPTAVEDYFTFGYVPDPKTIYAGARKLEPGHWLRLEQGAREPRIERYWDISFSRLGELEESAALEQLVPQLEEAVRIRMVAEVPLGAFLSGGVDSSSVVAMMSRLQQEPVNTCAIGFDVKQFDESDYARQVAQQYGCNHFEETVDPEDFSLVSKLAGLYDEPYADSSAMPTYRVCELARKRVTVALSGDGGDELFAGYRRYKLHMFEERLRSLLPLSVRRPLFGFLGTVYPKADWAPRVFRAKTTFQGLARSSVEAYLHTVSIFSDEQRRRLFTPEMRRELGGYDAIEVFNRHAERYDNDDPLALTQYLDIKTYLPGDILTKVDRASMAHSLEVRVPLLDHHFVEWTTGIASALKLRGRQGKYIFKKSLEPHLPDEILYRNKMGFAVPLAKWFRGPLKERIREAVTGPRLLDTGWFEADYLAHLLDAHQSGRRDYSSPLWTLLMFDAFMANGG